MSKPFSEEQLADIKARPEDYYHFEGICTLLSEIEQLRAERTIWQGIGEKVRGEYRAIPQLGGGVCWLRASDFGIDADPLTDDEMRLIFPKGLGGET